VTPADRGAPYDVTLRAPLAYHLVFLLPLVGSLIALHAIVQAGAPRAPLLVPLLSSLSLIALLAAFSSLRIRVAGGEIRVRYGLSSARIPVTAIEACEPVDHAPPRFAGWGIRRGEDGSVAYDLLGYRARALRIAYREGEATRTVLLVAPDPERLAAAIAAARGAIDPPDRSP
jgi:hypothetical protein